MASMTLQEHLAALTPHQKEKMDEFRQAISQWKEYSDEDLKFALKDETVFRYVVKNCVLQFRFLEGYHWDIEKGSKYLRKTLEWNNSYKPHAIRLHHVEHVHKSQYLFSHGNDKQGRPIIYMVMKNDDMKYDDADVEDKVYQNMIHNCIVSTFGIHCGVLRA